MRVDGQPALRVALFGLPGAGKSTSAGVLRHLLAERGHQVAVVKIAAPLYDVQEAFYRRACAPLDDGQQDGQLLNFLGSHFRAAAPGFLITDFGQRCSGALLGGADTIICDDARPADLEGLRAQGFALVRIWAPDALRRERKAGRGDRRAGDDNHPSELGLDAVIPDFEIRNADDLAGLHAQVLDLEVRLAELRSSLPAGSAAGDRQAALDALVGHARAAIVARYAENRHQIGAAILAADGRVSTGVHVEAMVGRASICAEAVALGKACEAGATDLRIVVAARHPKPSEPDQRIRLVPPCGLCREVLLDHDRDLRVLVDSPGDRGLVQLSQLLPHKYVGTKWTVPATDDRGAPVGLRG